MTATVDYNVPVLRFPDFSEEWRTVALLSIADIFDGTHQTPKYKNKGVKFVSVEDIADIYATQKYISKEAFDRDFKTKPQKDDILMTRITAGIIGATAVVRNNEPLGYYVSLALIRKKDSSVDTNFLNQRISSNLFKHELHKRIIHVAFPKKINLGEIGHCEISIPALPEQQKISSFLTAVDTKIQQLGKKKTLLEQYKKGMMQKLFKQEIRFKDEQGNDFPNWEEKRLEEVADTTTGSSNRQDSTETGEYAFFDRSNDIRASSTFLFDCEAIIIAGEGKKFIPRYFVGKFDLHQRAYATMNFKENSGKFLYFWMMYKSSVFLKYAVGSTMPSLRLPAFKNFPLNLPHPKEQQKIADSLSAIDRKIALIATELEQAQTFKKGLLQQMFI